MKWITRALPGGLILAAVVSLTGCYEDGPASAPANIGSEPPATPREVPIPASRNTPTPVPTTPAPTTTTRPAATTTPATTTAGSREGAYTVKPGDVCWQIAQDLGVTTAALMAANPRINGNCTNLRVGWELAIP